MRAGLRTLAAVAAVAVALPTILAVVALVAATTLIERAGAQTGEALASVHAAEELESSLLRLNRTRLLAPEGAAGREAVRRARAEVETWLGVARRHVGSAEEASILELLEARLRAFLDAVEAGEAEGRSAIEVYTAAAPALERLLTTAETLTSINLAQAEEAQRQAREVDRLSDVLALVAGILLALLVSVVLGSSAALVYRPLRRLARSIALFAEGDAAERSKVEGAHEIAIVARTFNEMADALQRQEEGRAALLAAVAHDLRNPLTAMSASVQMARRRADAPELKILERQLRRLDRLVEDLLDLQLIQAGRLELRLEPVNVGDVVRECVELQAPAAPAHRIEPVVEQGVTARADPGRLSQVVDNLLGNAIKYSPEGGTIFVRARSEGSRCAIEVEDPGIGMTPEEIQRAFAPFARMEPGRRAAPGLGLGLSIVRRLVVAQDGEIEVESRPGQGSLFRVLLPRA